MAALEHREDVLFAVGDATRAAQAHLLQHDGLELSHLAAKAGVGGDRARAEGGEQGKAPWLVDPVGQSGDPLAKELPARGVDPLEDRAHHHFHRDRLHLRPELEGLTGRPPGDLLAGDLAHHRPVVLHPRAVEGGQQALSIAHVLGLVEQHHRARPEQRLEQRVCLTGACAHQLRGAREDELDVLGVAQEHPRAPAADAQREDLPVARLTAIHQLQRAQRPDRSLQRRGDRRAGGKLALGLVRLSHRSSHRFCSRSFLSGALWWVGSAGKSACSATAERRSPATAGACAAGRGGPPPPDYRIGGALARDRLGRALKGSSRAGRGCLADHALLPVGALRCAGARRSDRRRRQSARAARRRG